jgi:hypothetical protein
MATRTRDRPGLGGAAKLVADRARSIVRLEIELAVSELKRKVAALGLGIAMLVGAAIFGVFALGFALATIAAGLAATLSTWLALLIVAGALFLVTGLLVALGLRAIRKGTPPIPEQAIEEAKLTMAAVTNGKH